MSFSSVKKLKTWNTSFIHERNDPLKIKCKCVARLFPNLSIGSVGFRARALNNRKIDMCDTKKFTTSNTYTRIYIHKRWRRNEILEVSALCAGVIKIYEEKNRSLFISFFFIYNNDIWWMMNRWCLKTGRRRATVP